MPSRIAAAIISASAIAPFWSVVSTVDRVVDASDNTDSGSRRYSGLRASPSEPSTEPSPVQAESAEASGAVLPLAVLERPHIRRLGGRPRGRARRSRAPQAASPDPRRCRGTRPSAGGVKRRLGGRGRPRLDRGELDGGHVAPQLLEPVEATRLRREEVEDDVEVVGDDPTRLGHARRGAWEQTVLLLQDARDLVVDRLRLASVASFSWQRAAVRRACSSGFSSVSLVLSGSAPVYSALA
jgi:hypothetical protein